MLFSFHVFVCFSGYFLWLISSSIPLWSAKKFEMTSAFWNLLSFILCHNRWSTLENIPCALEESVYSTDRGEMLWRYQINPFALMCHLSHHIPVGFPSGNLSTEVNGVLKALTRTVFLSSSPFRSINICSTCLGFPVLGV